MCKNQHNVSIIRHCMKSVALILAACGERIANYRIARNMKQSELAEAAGVGRATLARLEKDGTASMDTLARVMIALNIDDRLIDIVPDTKLNPMDPVAAKGRRRQRVRDKKGKAQEGAWTWGDETS